MDVLGDVLGALRLSGGVILEGEGLGDWCVLSQLRPEDCAELFPASGQIIAYHYVTKGVVFAKVDGIAEVEAGPGSILLFPRNDPHFLYSAQSDSPIDSHELVVPGQDGRIARFSVGTAGAAAEFYCGFLGVATPHALLDCLPPLLLLDRNRTNSEWLESNLKFLAGDAHSPGVVARIAELMFAEAVRAYLEETPAGEGGWIGGLRDPAVARALAHIHRHYADDLDVDGLAKKAGVSRSVLGERFVELLGEPPMRYCARWRMRMAANLLRDGKDHAANIAYAVGFNSEAAFNRAFKREFGDPPATWKRKIDADALARAEAAAALPAQVVRFCKARDGTGLAYSIVGDGTPLVKTANWLNHIEHDWDSPLWRHWIHAFTAQHALVRYDERASGMSDWDTPEISFDAFVDDLECVVDCAGLEQFDLLAISQGAAVAIAYAVRHPERVRKLVLLGGYAAGWATRGEPDEVARREAMLTLTEVGWGADNPAYRQLFTSLYIPGGTARQASWFNEMQRLSASAENAVKLQRALSRIDVRDLLAQVRVPTLVFHARGDQVVPFEAGEAIADGIPGSTFVPLVSQNHILLENEPAWQSFVQLTRQFLARDGSEHIATVRPPPLPAEDTADIIAPDGTRVAFATGGAGIPLIKAPNWITHLELDRTSPVYGHWIAECSRSHRFVRADMRGFGRSDWHPPHFDFDVLLSDLEQLIDRTTDGPCDLLGISHGVPLAIAYAGRHPTRVRRLVLVNGFAAGWRVRADPEELAWRNSLMEMNRREWSFRRSLLGEMFLTLYFPAASQSLIDWHNEHFEQLGPIANMERMIEVAASIDVRPYLSKVVAPTLVCHSKDDANAPIAAGRTLAAQMADARFVELDSANHILLGDEPAWDAFKHEFPVHLGH